MAPASSCGMHHLERNSRRKLPSIKRSEFFEAEKEVMLTLVDRCGTVGTSMLALAPQAGSVWSQCPALHTPTLHQVPGTRRFLHARCHAWWTRNCTVILHVSCDNPAASPLPCVTATALLHPFHLTACTPPWRSQRCRLTCCSLPSCSPADQNTGACELMLAQP